MIRQHSMEPARASTLISQNGQNCRPPESSALFIPNSGLVLLTPFLPHFFRRLELTNARGVFNSVKDHARAVMLLQRLLYPASTPLAEPPDQYLALNKLLCGWALSLPLPPLREAQLWPDLGLEIHCLLRAAITQWGEPADIGQETLMRMFLRRKGKLHVNGSARLRVETSPLDLLLRSLPWSLDRLQTPWMGQPLQVDWLN